MAPQTRGAVGAATGLALTLALACAGAPPTGLGVRDGALAPCPASPNCVSSAAGDAEHAIEPLAFEGDPAVAWAAARSAVRELPRTRIVLESEGYLHAESSSALFGFVDDLELWLRPEAGHIAVRSASRVGYSDLGVNRERVEALRTALAQRGGPPAP
ncbi:MAG: DUF1499 domain-containing protein [Myxococcota bacterium]